MGIYEKIIEVYPELTGVDFKPAFSINLQNDSDGIGDYISKWEYDQPIPKGLKLGKPKG
jgi:hypothetical protein